MSFGVLMIGVSHVTIGPFPFTVVYGSQHIHTGHIPAMYVEIHLLHIVIVAGCIVGPCVVVHHHGYLTVLSALTDERQHIVSELIEDVHGILSAVYTLVAQTKSNDDIASEVVQHLIIAVEQVLGGVSSYGNAAYGEGRVTLTLFVAFCQHLAIHIGISPVAFSSFAVTYR